MKRLCCAALLVMIVASLSRAAAEPADVSPYGIHSHVTRGDEHPFLAKEIERMQEAGIRWLRTGFCWSQIERREGEFTFDRCDDVVDACEEAGIRIMGLLHSSPRWARPTIEHLDEWCRFVRTTVTRYKGRVPAWQVWNEPNLDGFWKNPNPHHYAALLKATYEEIKRTDPAATVVWGATSRIEWTFLEPALADADGKFDVMSIHPYGYGDPRAPEVYIPDALDEVRMLLARHGAAGKPIWFTEWGWPAHTGRRGMTDGRQARHLVRAYLVAMRAGMARGFWYEFQERKESDEENEDAFGILEHDLRPKPAYRAYATLIQTLPPGSAVVETPWKRGLIYYPAWRRPDGSTVHAMWLVWGRWKSPRRTPVRLKGRLAEAHDEFGRPVEIQVDAAGRATLPLEWGSLLYLVGPEAVVFE